MGGQEGQETSERPASSREHSSVAETRSSRNKSIQPLQRNKHVKKRPARTNTKAEKTRCGRLRLPLQYRMNRGLFSLKVVEVTL